MVCPFPGQYLLSHHGVNLVKFVPVLTGDVDLQVIDRSCVLSLLPRPPLHTGVVARQALVPVAPAIFEPLVQSFKSLFPPPDELPIVQHNSS